MLSVYIQSCYTISVNASLLINHFYPLVLIMTVTMTVTMTITMLQDWNNLVAEVKQRKENLATLALQWEDFDAKYKVTFLKFIFCNIVNFDFVAELLLIVHNISNRCIQPLFCRRLTGYWRPTTRSLPSLPPTSTPSSR